MEAINLLHWLDLWGTLVICLGSSPLFGPSGWNCASLLLISRKAINPKQLADTAPPLQAHKKRMDRWHNGGKLCTKLLVFKIATHIPLKHESCLQTIMTSFGHLLTRLSAPMLHLWKTRYWGRAYRCEWSFGITGKNEAIVCDWAVSILEWMMFVAQTAELSHPGVQRIQMLQDYHRCIYLHLSSGRESQLVPIPDYFGADLFFIRYIIHVIYASRDFTIHSFFPNRCRIPLCHASRVFLPNLRARPLSVARLMSTRRTNSCLRESVKLADLDRPICHPIYRVCAPFPGASCQTTLDRINELCRGAFCSPFCHFSHGQCNWCPRVVRCRVHSIPWGVRPVRSYR